MPDNLPRIIPGCEPFSAPGGPNGALVIHGFTGNPHSMRGLAQAFSIALRRAAISLGLEVVEQHPKRAAVW